ncbi:MAG TPA: hypothetical protein PLP26_04990, partial [Ilumatobacteraceae bacterium]|nr:hypothetical protein [Ilumatobacteraceae bacterium]
MKRTVFATLSVALLVAACSDDGSTAVQTTTPAIETTVAETVATTPDTEAPTTTVEVAPQPTPADAATIAEVEAALAAGPAGCDPLDTKRCLLPFPSNDYTTVDTATDT